MIIVLSPKCFCSCLSKILITVSIGLLIIGGSTGCQRDDEVGKLCMYELVSDVEIENLREFFDVLLSMISVDTLDILYSYKYHTLYTHERISAINEVSWYILALAGFYSGGPFDHLNELNTKWDVGPMRNTLLGIFSASLHRNESGKYELDFDNNRTQRLLRHLDIDLDRSLSLLQRRARKVWMRNIVEVEEIITEDTPPPDDDSEH